MFSINTTNRFRRIIALVLIINVFISGCSPRIASGSKEVVQTQHDQDEFSIAVLPDTQYYTSEKNGGKKEMFTAQIDWIKKNRETENIKYVIHVGDISETGDSKPLEWENAKNAMYGLETPLPGLPDGIPYGIAIGNHDQVRSQYPLSGETKLFNKYFGADHFKDRKYYGGHYGRDNDSHYDLFSAGGYDFIAIYIEYDSMDEDQENMNTWACDLLEKYPLRKAIIVSHFIVVNNATAGTNEKGFAPFGKQGIRIYDRLKRYPNVFMMLCGHIGANGEGYRQDSYAGSTIKSFLADYQSRPNGGDGLMRLMTFSKSKDLIRVKTFSPYTGVEEHDDDSEFTKPWFGHTNTSRIFDFDNDSKTDAVVYDQGNWGIVSMSGTRDNEVINLGMPGDIAVPADYDGDGKTEPAIFRPSEGKFYLYNGKEEKWGKAGDIPVPADYDGDGYADFAVYRPSDQKWYVKGMEPVKLGEKGCIPVPADYDGDGKVDMGIYRPKSGYWTLAGLLNLPFGEKGDIPVPGDYDGDGRAEIAIFRPSTGEWIVDSVKPNIKLGQEGDIPVAGNYFGDGKIHPAVYRNGQILFADQPAIKLDGKPGVQPLNLPYAIWQAFFN